MSIWTNTSESESEKYESEEESEYESNQEPDNQPIEPTEYVEFPKELSIQHIEKYGIVTTAFTLSKEEVYNLYAPFIKIKQVIANQPIKRGGSKCTDSCDTENHHIHTYCTMCKRNLFYGTVVHDCAIGFGIGQKHFEMDPNYLINIPWWIEPLRVQRYNNYIHLEYLMKLLLGLSFYDSLDTIPFKPEIIAELD